MNNIKYHLDLGSTSACTKKIMEATKGFVQRDVNLSNNGFFFLVVGFPQRGSLKL